MNLNSKGIRLLLIVLLLFLVTGCDDGNVDNSEFVTVKEETIDQTIDSLTLKWNSGIVKFSKSSDNAIHIEERAKEDFQERNIFSTEINGSSLTINDPNYDQPVIMLSHDVNIQIPDINYKTVTINGTSIEINFEDFKSEELILDNNTTIQNISGEFNKVSTTFTSSELNYNLSKMPAELICDGYNSEGEINIPSNSEFELTENLDQSEVNNNFEVKDQGDNKFVLGNGGNKIDIKLYQSNLILGKIE